MSNDINPALLDSVQLIQIFESGIRTRLRYKIRELAEKFKDELNKEIETMANLASKEVVAELTQQFRPIDRDRIEFQISVAIVNSLQEKKNDN